MNHSHSEDQDDLPWYDGLKKARQENNRQQLEDNMQLLIESGLPFDITNLGQAVLFRQQGKPKVDFFPSTGRWRVAGIQKTFNGGAVAFLEWYEKQSL